MKKNVLEIETKEINKEYSVWWITYQDEEMLPRGEFEDDELRVYSFMQPTIFEDEKEGWILNIKGKAIHYDITPKILKNKYLPILIKKVNKINEKYGIEKFEIDKVPLYEEYFYITDFFELRKDKNAGHDLDKKRYDCYNHFINEEECEWCAKKMKAYLLKLIKEWREKNGLSRE